jgi:hypothetical protein
VTWSQLFTSNPNPYAFNPSLNSTTWSSKNSSVEPVAELDALINAVVAKLNEEGKKINSSYNVTLEAVRSAIVGNYSGMTYQQKFNAVVGYARQALTQSKESSIDREDIKSFYERYYFYTPTKSQLDTLVASYQTNDYGFGSSTQSNLKTSALNRSVQFGLVPSGTTLSQYETLTNKTSSNLLVDRLKSLNRNSSIFNDGVIESNPYDAAYAFLQLRESGKISQVNGTNTYTWSSTGSWKDLASFNNGSLLDTYQSLIIDYEKSGVSRNGTTLSQFIAERNRTVYDQIKQDVEKKRIDVDTSVITYEDAKEMVESSVKAGLNESINRLNLENKEQEAKINALRNDAFREAQAALARQKRLETINGDSTFGAMNDMFQSMSKELGLKEGFFNSPGFQSNISFNWQKWFETELKNRYDPSNPRNEIGRIIGRTEEDARLAAAFAQDFLQRRFDGSKSLAEFTEYVNSGDINPVLEKTSQSAFQSLTKSGYKELMGKIDDPQSTLGNFWTNLQAMWAKGRSFDSGYYLGQSLGEVNGQDMTINNLHKNIAAIHNIAVSKGTTNLNPLDIKNLNLSNVNKESNSELQQQINLYQSWFNKSYASGVDLLNEKEFAKLHFDTYAKNSADPSLFLKAGVNLSINDAGLFTDVEARKIAEQIQFLTKEADKYLSQIQFGTFKTPEEHMMEMMQKTGVINTKDGGMFADAGLSDVVKQYIEQFSGAIASFAGESIRKQIRTAIDSGRTPDQKALGIEYIQRTKDQALATIRSLISKESFSNRIVIDNAPGIKVSESISTWFSKLGLELLPGQSWTDFKKANGISSTKSYYDWEKEVGTQVDPVTGKTQQNTFWEYWAKNNNMQIIESNDANSASDTRLTIVVEQPSQSWVAWAQRISTSDTDNPRLEGAVVSVRSDAFNGEWYSKTNPYTKVKDDWNNIVMRANQDIMTPGSKRLAEWAKDNGLNPEEAWKQYRTQQQQTSNNFGKDVAGNDMSYVTWAQGASQAEKDKFWRDSNPFWFNYLQQLGVVKSGTANAPRFKTWSEWATEKNISLTRLSSDAKAMPPREFMEIHYYAMGGSKKVNEEYVRTYFPEFDELEAQGIVGKSALANSPFDLSAFGLRDEINSTLNPITKTNRKSLSPIDFAMKDMFGDSMNPDSFGNFESKPLNDFNLKIDMSYNKTMNQKKDFTNFDFGFGDFGGSGFGF